MIKSPFFTDLRTGFGCRGICYFVTVTWRMLLHNCCSSTVVRQLLLGDCYSFEVEEDAELGGVLRGNCGEGYVNGLACVVSEICADTCGGAEVALVGGILGVGGEVDS